MRVVLCIQDLCANLNPVQRRLSEIQFSVGDQIPHVSEEEGQQQRADVISVAISIHHQDDLVVAQEVNIKLGAESGAQCFDQIFNFLALQNLAGGQ